MPNKIASPFGPPDSHSDKNTERLLGSYTRERSRKDRVRQGIEFVYGQLPERMGMSMEDVKKALGEEDSE